MHPKRFPSLPSPALPDAAAPPTPTNQIFMLERELLHALEHAARLQRRARAAERELAQVRGEAAVRAQESHVRLADLEHQLHHARCELARSKADGRERLRAMRLEWLATEAQCKALDEVCRALLLTIEHAACSDLGEPRCAAGVSP